MSDFPSGIFAKKPHQNAPAFVKAKISVKIKDAIEYLQGLSGEYLNMDLKESKEGKMYLQIDTWKPNQQPAPEPSDLPFP